MKKTLFLTALVCAALGAVSAQQETPMFFTADADVKAGIGSARYSPDGRNIAVEHKGTILFYDAANGRELRRLPKQDTDVASSLNFAYNPNGRQIATYFWYSNAIKILNAETGNLARTIPWPDSDTNPLAYSPDGSRIAARSGDIIRIWNTANGSETGTLPASDIPYMGSSNIIYHPNGKRLLAASAYGFTIYNVDTRQALKSMAADKGSSFGTVTYSPDGSCIVTLYGARTNRKVKIFDAETGQELRTITAEGNFSSAAYSPDGKHLLVRYSDNNRNYIVKILDAETGRELRTLTTRDYMFSWSPDGRRIISVPGKVYEGNDLVLAGSWATVWDASSGRKLLTIGYGPLNAGARAYADMQVARFLGDTAAVGRHEGIIKFITDRGNVSRAEVEAFYRQNIGTLIAQTVDAEFNSVLFALDVGDKSYDTTLTQNSDRSYTIRYELNTVENDDVEFTRPNLDALSDELKKRGFTSGNCDTVRWQSTLFPALSRINGVTDNNTMDLIKHLLVDFYTTNNQTTILNDYKALLAIYNRYNNMLFSDVGSVGRAMGALGGAITALNPELGQIFRKDAASVRAASRHQSQQVKTSLMSNDVNVLAGTVGELGR